MKRLLITLLLSGAANAHSQLPGEIKEYVVQPVNKFTVKLVNTYPKLMCYDVYENGKQTLRAPICLDSGASRSIDFWVNTPKDEMTYNDVCTQARNDGHFKVRMCTKIITYYPASSLQ